MVLQGRFAPSVSRRGVFAIILVACAVLVLPSLVPAPLRHARAGTKQEAQTAPAPREEAAARTTQRLPMSTQFVVGGRLNFAEPAAPATQRFPFTIRFEQVLTGVGIQSSVNTHEFPCAVRFEQGATRFLKDDTIAIQEVRGTAEAFVPGNVYWIKGTYKLASHDRAMLAAFTTARDAKDGRGSYLKVQTTTVNRGDGTFTLFLPMTCEGWPHVSFYPAGGGEGFGGNYFGTGDSVLKRWWGSKENE